MSEPPSFVSRGLLDLCSLALFCPLISQHLCPVRYSLDYLSSAFSLTPTSDKLRSLTSFFVVSPTSTDLEFLPSYHFQVPSDPKLGYTDFFSPEQKGPALTVTDEGLELTSLDRSPSLPSSASASPAPLDTLALDTNATHNSFYHRAPTFTGRKSRSVILPPTRVTATYPRPQATRASSYTISSTRSLSSSFNRSPQLSSPSTFLTAQPPFSQAMPTSLSITPSLPRSRQTGNRIASGASMRTTTTTSSILGMGPFPPGLSCASSIANLCSSLEMQVMSNQVGLEDWRGRVAREAEMMLE